MVKASFSRILRKWSCSVPVRPRRTFTPTERVSTVRMEPLSLGREIGTVLSFRGGLKDATATTRGQPRSSAEAGSKQPEEFVVESRRPDETPHPGRDWPNEQRHF